MDKVIITGLVIWKFHRGAVTADRVWGGGSREQVSQQMEDGCGVCVGVENVLGM